MSGGGGRAPREERQGLWGHHLRVGIYCPVQPSASISRARWAILRGSLLSAAETRLVQISMTNSPSMLLSVMCQRQAHRRRGQRLVETGRLDTSDTLGSLMLPVKHR